MEELKDYIIKESKKLDIDIIGFSKCRTLIENKDYLEKRIIDGKITEFEEEDISLRIDPTNILDNCKSVISIAISYNVDILDNCGVTKYKGKISKSSWGKDYHIVLREKMTELVEKILVKTNFSYRIVVDTSPFLDRDYANISGIGYFGKNCSIINKDYGSFIFLGHILTDLDLDSNDERIKSECKDCDICLKACPTKALESAYRVNPKKCISYLTQTKEYIPENLREKMGISLYGCDICQKVCPKNKSAIKKENSPFIPEQTKGYMDILEILNMSNKEFKNKYGSMAGAWRGKGIFRRNAIIALGNMGDLESIDILSEELKKGIEKDKEYILWAINKIKEREK